MLALVITRILGGIRWVFHGERMYWVHAAYVVSTLVLTSLIWWGLWYQNDTKWSYLLFAYNLLIGPGIMFFLAALLVPETPRRIRSWRAHFYSVRRLLYGVLVASTVALFTGSIWITDTPLLHPAHAVVTFAFILALVGLTSDAHRVHAVLAIVMLTLIAASVFLAATAGNVPQVSMPN